MKSVFLVLVLATSVSVATPQRDSGDRLPTKATERAAWQWNDDDRLGVRFDPVSMRERSSREATEPYGVQPPAVVTRGGKASQSSIPADGNVIIGRRNPELFMPFELFGFLIAKGFSEDASERADFRNTLVASIRNGSTKPDVFWAAVDAAASDFIRNQQEERRLLARLNASRSDDERSAIRQDIKNVQQTECSQRAAAINTVVRRVGKEALYRVLYEAIAPTVTVTSFEPDTPARLKFIAGGCR